MAWWEWVILGGALGFLSLIMWGAVALGIAVGNVEALKNRRRRDLDYEIQKHLRGGR